MRITGEGCQMRSMKRIMGRFGAAVLLAVAVSVGATGCAGNSAGPESVVTEFTAALASSDLARACELLTPSTRTEVEQIGRTECAEALADLEVPTSDAVVSTETYGRAALVETEDDTLFLARTGPTWAIRAAGCAPVTDAPFDCMVSGD